VGLFFRPRRPLLRLAAGATTATIACKAGQRRAEQDAYNEQAQAAYQATQAPPPAYAAPAPAAAPETDTIAELERFRQYWDEVAPLEGLGLLPED
jgi:hypothetical protein